MKWLIFSIAFVFATQGEVAAAVKRTSTSPAGLYIDANLILGTGTWTYAQGPNAGRDVNETIKFQPGKSVNFIRCQRALMVCVDAIASVSEDEGELNAGSTIYNITKWSGSELTARHVGDCTVQELTIDLVKGSAMQMERDRADPASMCKNSAGVPLPLKVPQIYKFTYPSEVKS